MFQPIRIRFISSTSTIQKWIIVIVDSRVLFLQTVSGQRDVNGIPPGESKYGNLLWILETADFRSINSNAKWQPQSDALFFKLGYNK